MNQKNRNEIDDNYKWDLTYIFKSDDEFLSVLNNINDKINIITEFKGHILDDSNSLLNFLETQEDLERSIYKLYYYASLKHDEDTTNTRYQNFKGLVDNLINTYSELSSYIIPEMLEKDYDYVLSLINNDLEKYRFNLENIYRYKGHTLSKKEEEILSTLSKALSTPEDVFSALLDADISFGYIHNEDGNRIELTESNYSLIIRSKDRKVRKDGFKLLYKTYQKYKNTLSLTFRNNIEVLTKMAKIKNFNSSIEASLFDDNLDISIYNNLVDTVNNNLKPLHDYYRLKKDVLGLKSIHLYDVYVDLVDKYDKNYDFESAKDIVINALKPLGDDYIKIINKAFDEKWIDVYNNKGKRTGAYSSGFYDTNPYILLNYEGKIDDVSTLAHELGHSVHTYLSCQNNTYNNSQYKIFVAEVASTVNEVLLRLYLLNNSNSKEEKLYVINQMLELIKSTVYRQTMFAEFERDMHKLHENGNILTYELLCDKYYELNKKYFGNDVIVDKEIMYEWERIPHFYYDFYVYIYAIGLSSALKIAYDIYNKKENALENYMRFLKSGGSNYPKEELLIAGIDISKPELITDAIKVFEEMLEEAKKILKEGK